MRFEISDADTAAALGSGDLPVLGTPRLLAWMEAASLQTAAPLLAPEQTSVGTAVRIRHRRPTPVGQAVEVHAQLRSHEGKHVTFGVQATNQSGDLIADGEIDRIIVDRGAFMARSV